MNEQPEMISENEIEGIANMINSQPKVQNGQDVFVGSIRVGSMKKASNLRPDANSIDRNFNQSPLNTQSSNTNQRQQPRLLTVNDFALPHQNLRFGNPQNDLAQTN